MAKPAARIVFMEALLILAGAAVVARSFWLQVVHYKVWVDKAAKGRGRDEVVPARRGRIYDRNGAPLAVSREQYHISIAMNQVRDTAALQALLVADLWLPRAKVADQFARDDAYFYGPFGAEQVARVRKLRGVRLETMYSREYPMQALGDRILGRLNERGDSGIEGMEKALDTLLQGKPGLQHVLMDAKGRKIRLPGPPIAEPVAGRDVLLTLDNDLQGIAEGALRAAIREHNAFGGDVVVIDVRTGELLAVASRRRIPGADSAVSTSSAIVEPNQPGSTSKLFTVAAILRSGADTTPVLVEGGHWDQPVSRKTTRSIDDVHALHGPVTLGEMVKYSSNIAATKFSMKLTKDQQYEALRDFGFGAFPGLGFPGEAPGKLRRPVLWENDLLSMGSLAMGYEWEASSVQVAAGYAAIANHGVLMAPSLLREVRDEHGTPTWTHRADTLRRAVPESVAGHLFEYLMLTEGDGGTGAKAQLDRFPVPGKTGTAKVDGGGYRASFAGIFPAIDPQVIVYVMIDRPGGKLIYGGEVAAPVVRQLLQQALLARTSPLDRRWLVEAKSPGSPAVAIATPAPTAPVRVGVPVAPIVAAAPSTMVPNVSGQAARSAVVTMQRAGFQVRLIGRARVRTSNPAAGDSLPRGSTVTIYADSLR